MITLTHRLSKDKAGTKFYQITKCTIGNVALAWGSYGSCIVLKTGPGGEPIHKLARQTRVWFEDSSRPFIIADGAELADGAAESLAGNIWTKKEKSKSGYRFGSAAPYTEQVSPRELLDFLSSRASMNDETKSDLISAIVSAGVEVESALTSAPTGAGAPEIVRENDTAKTNDQWGTW